MIITRNVPIPDWIPIALERARYEGYFQADVSNYAPGRERLWFPHEWDLKNKAFTQSIYQNIQLWKWCQSVWPEAEIGLISFSGEHRTSGIKLHRDDSYADFKAVGINLTGTCKFTYLQSYRSFEWDPNKDPETEHVLHLKPGDVYEFNCKNRHSAEPGPGRYAINLWHVSRKQREPFNAYLKTT